MNVELAVVADYANTSADGKLNILGIFNTIYAASYPAVHPDMKVVIRFGVHPSEIGPTRRLVIQLRSDDGRKVLEAVHRGRRRRNASLSRSDRGYPNSTSRLYRGGDVGRGD